MKPRLIAAALLTLAILLFSFVPMEIRELAVTAFTAPQQANPDNLTSVERSGPALSAAAFQPVEVQAKSMQPDSQSAAKAASRPVRKAANPMTAETGLALPTSFPSFPTPIARTPTARSRETISERLQKFINRVINGHSNLVSGVYVQGVLAMPVVQQPNKNPAYVSEKWGEVTQFHSAADNDIVGLLAHNYLSGQSFYNLKLGQEVDIVYGDGTIERFVITKIQRFQKLTPSSLRSEFIDLQTNEHMSTAEVFDRFYDGGQKVTFQTCLENEGISNWGLVFIVATPLIQ